MAEIKKILIANRGEIACRVIKTARRMNIATVAVYSDADAEAMHVAMADEAVRIGRPAVAESYLQAEKIIDAAKRTGADAVHPGYGFLSENPEFVEAVEAAGLIFIGPSAGAIRAMGLKDAAKTLMEKAGVPVVPGYHGDMQEPGFLAAKANEIGFPVLIKARAGGGGKGMRKVDEPKRFASALGSCRSEAKASFGDDRVLIEKYVTEPRHIEVQVFGDNHGNVVHLFERDCSLQRRHQKVIEEAPAPGMTDEMREAMTSAAVKAAQAIGYSGAGTVEFIVDGSDGLTPDGFWFMEMNTRLQVEHPVTEEVTGLDLVEWQIKVAAGGILPLAQDEITLEGHAFEARLYAEDVAKGFLPATGTLQALDFPDDARIDTGVGKGSVISPWYDPMIAKVVTRGNNRAEALDHLNAALRHCKIAGTVTNRTFLESLTRHPGFASGDVDTGLIERDIEMLTDQMPLDAEAIGIAGIIHYLTASKAGGNDPFSVVGSFSLWGDHTRRITLRHSGDNLDVDIVRHSNGSYSCCTQIGTLEMPQCRINVDHSVFEYISKGKKKSVSYASWPGNLAVFVAGQEAAAVFEFAVIDPLDVARGDEAGSDLIMAPMPGLVRKLDVVSGEAVKKGQSLLVLEAMKMEYTLVAPRDGVLDEITVSEGNQVEDGAILIALVPVSIREDERA